MSIIYYLVIEKIGYFSLGRAIDLFQLDIIITLLTAILIYEVKRWYRLKDL